MHTLWPGLFLLACCGLTLDAMMKGTRAMTPVLHDGAAAGKIGPPPLSALLEAAGWSQNLAEYSSL